MKQASLAMPVKRALAIALSLVLACTTVLVAPHGYAEETVELHKYQQANESDYTITEVNGDPTYVLVNPDTGVTVRTKDAAERDDYIKLGMILKDTEVDKKITFEVRDLKGGLQVYSLRKPSMFDGYKYYYTPLEEERDMYVSLGWDYMGEINTGQEYYNLYNPNSGEYFCTLSKLECVALVDSAWTFRGFRYGGEMTGSSEETPVYRLYNGSDGQYPHYYTRDRLEKAYLVSEGWSDEGVSGYSFPETEEDLATVLESLKPADPSDNPSDLPTDGTITVSGDTGIRAEGNLSGANIPENATLEVKAEAVTSGAYFDGLDKSMGDARISDVYEITLMVNNQSVHDSFGELSISLPIDAKYNGHVIIVHHHQGADGITKTRAIARDGYVSFTVTSLSGFAMEDTGIETQTMYRLYNPNSGEHFYTASTVERDATVAAGWNDEGIGWIAPSTSAAPVYRLYSGTDHHYTMSTVERDDLVSKGWTLEGENAEGIAWYSDDAKTVPLYRQFNPNVDPSAPTGNSGSHNYTTSLDEHNSLVSIGWHDENIGWYAVAEK